MTDRWLPRLAGALIGAAALAVGLAITPGAAMLLAVLILIALFGSF